MIGFVFLFCLLFRWGFLHRVLLMAGWCQVLYSGGFLSVSSHYLILPTERLHFHFSLSCIGEGNGNPLQCSCLENPRDEGAWWAAVYGVTQSWTRLKWLSSSSGRVSSLVVKCLGDSASTPKAQGLICELTPLCKHLLNSTFSVLAQTWHSFLSERKWSEVAQSCPTLCNPMDCSLPGSSLKSKSITKFKEMFTDTRSMSRKWNPMPPMNYLPRL